MKKLKYEKFTRRNQQYKIKYNMNDVRSNNKNKRLDK